jgi:hypothetical protein
VTGSAGREGSSRGAGALNMNMLRAFAGPRAALLGGLALALAFLWIRPADALPAFAGQTGLPCSACHVGGFGPQLTPFGISFRANGYTLSGGTGPWAHIPVSILISPSYQKVATALPAPPDGYSTTNDFFNLLGSGAAIYIAGGHSFDGKFGIGGFEQLGFSMNPGGPLIATEATSDLKITKPFSLGDHSLLLGLDITNKPSGGDPYNTLYNDFSFPFFAPFVSLAPAADPAIDALGNSVYGVSLYAFYDQHLYVEAGIRQTWSPDILNFMNVGASSLGTIAGAAPYFRIAQQYAWNTNFLEAGAVFLYAPLQQIPGAADVSAQDSYTDWGFDLTYQRTFGADRLTVTGNILFENQNLAGSLANGLSSNASNYLTQFRLAAAYYWHDTYGLTLAYSAMTGSADPTLYAPAPLTGSANGSPNSQAIIGQIDWTPFGNDTTHAGYPWLNVRVALQYTYYLQFNGGTTNYDGSGRNASDNNQLLLFTWWAF